MTAPSPSANMSDSTNNSNLHLRINVEDAPPPYSETDIYSNSGGRSPQSTGPAHADDAASRVSSTSAGDIIYTPPQTPRSSSNSHTFNIPPSPSANLYFDDHPAPLAADPHVSELIVHKVSVKPDSRPEDLPYPSNWAGRDVTQQDWATFVNFLIPYHDAEVNEAIIGEKVRSDDVPQIRGEKTPTEGSVKPSSTAGRMNNHDEAMRRRAEIEATVQQWNDGFFALRGVHVQLEPLENEPRIPGAWDTAFDQAPPASGTAEAGPSSERDAGEPSQQQQRGGWGSGFGGFRINGDSVRLGDSFVADSNGLRIGNLVMDNNGIRLNGRGGMPPGPETRGGPAFPPFAQYSHPGTGPWSPHRGRSAVPHRDGAHSRSSSVSSSSSSSSDSSDSDASSIGSLPEYEDLRDPQLSVFVERLKAWTVNPNKVRTKADMKQLRAELKACKSNDGPALGDMDRSQLRAQIKALKQQWRVLKKQQRKERREHKKERKQRRKEERKEKRQRKKELRRARKEAHRGHRGGHRGHLAPPPVPPPGPIPIPHAHAPQVPPVPPVPQSFGPESGWGWGWGQSRGQNRVQNRGRGCRNGSGGRGGFFGAHSPSIPSFDRNNHGGPFGPHGPLGPHGPFGPHGPLGPNGIFGPQGDCESRGFGGRRGRGCGRDGRFPGSWPENRQGEDVRGEDLRAEDADLPPPGPVSAEKYRTVDGLEEEIKSKQANLTEVTAAERRAVEKELDALVEKLDHLRTEADEAYARELQSGEGQYHADRGF